MEKEQKPVQEQQEPPKEVTEINELVGGIKNALERKQSIQQVQQSFLNAGYTQEEIQKATQEIQQQHPDLLQQSQIPQEQTQTQQTAQPQVQPQPAQVQQTQQLSQQQVNQQQQKKSKKTIYVILGIIALLVLVGAALTGIFWDKISDFF